jgi:hypothetical protein
MCFERYHEGSLSSFVVSAYTPQNALVAFLFLLPLFHLPPYGVKHDFRVIGSVLVHKVCHLPAPARPKREERSG